MTDATWIQATDEQGTVTSDAPRLDAADAVSPDAGDYAADAVSADAGDYAADALSPDAGDYAADYIEGLLDICDLDGDIEIEEQRGRYVLTVTAPDGASLPTLSAPETVTALQELTRLAVQARTGEFARLTLDIGGSRDQRTRELSDLIAAAAAAIAGGRARVELDPMSSYERKLVHDLVAEHGLQSHSEGEGPDRHTVVTGA